MKIKDLNPAPYNPRKMSDEKLEMLGKAMQEFGDLSGIVMNIRTGNLVGGHQRLKHFDPAWPIKKRKEIDSAGTVAVGFCSVKIPTEDRTFCEQCGEKESGHYATRDDDGREYLACYYRGNFQEYRPRTVKAPELSPEEKWTPRESHDITSPSLFRNGRYFRADHKITVSHTSHATVVLPPGEYRLYALQVADAD